MTKKAFTLIELLVVIAIIAILAAILFPVFAQAKQAAKKSADLSNLKQMGIGLQLYIADYDDIYPQAYYYINDNNSTNGYAQWSGTTQPYIKNIQIFVSPGDKVGGLAPTNFIGNNQGYGAPSGQVTQNAVQDIQAPRLSYTANSLIMPRKRRTVDPMNVVGSGVIDDVSGTILIAPMTDIPACINDSSSASGVAFKTHRSANGIKLLAGGVFTGEDPAQIGNAAYYAVSTNEAIDALRTCPTASSNGKFHIAYTSPYRFGGSSNEPNKGGANYVFADTSAKFLGLAATLNPNKFYWGKRAYTAGGGQIYKPGTTVNVD